MRIPTLLAAIATALQAACGDVSVTNTVLMVDQDGNINVPDVLATTADMATASAGAAIAKAKADAAKDAVNDCTNLIQGIVSQIAANELVVYRQGFTDSFASTVFLSADAKCVIYDFKPCVAESGGLVGHDICYALTESPGAAAAPVVLYRDSLASGDFQALDQSKVGAPVSAAPYEGEDGTVYSHGYRVRVWTPSSRAGFFQVNITGSDPLGAGFTFDIVGGVTGGKSATVTWGDSVLTFRGGLLTEVGHAE